MVSISLSDDSWTQAGAAFAKGDLATSLRIFEGLAKQGEWLAYAEIGNLLELGGAGVQRDLERALYWYRRAVFESDDPNAHFALARLFFNGTEVERDYEKAHYHADKALAAKPPYQLADQYRGMAYVMQGFIYANGQSVIKDLSKARAILTEGASAGYIWPMFELSALELKRWHIVKWIALRVKAAKTAAALLAKNPDDPKLVGLNSPQVINRWWARIART